MRILVIALAASAIASPALANHVTSPNGTVLHNAEFAAEGYANRGQCQAVLAKVRNAQRANPETRGEGYRDLSPSDFQKASLKTTRCEAIDGRYHVVFNANGF